MQSNNVFCKATLIFVKPGRGTRVHVEGRGPPDFSEQLSGEGVAAEVEAAARETVHHQSLFASNKNETMVNFSRRFASIKNETMAKPDDLVPEP